MIRQLGKTGLFNEKVLPILTGRQINLNNEDNDTIINSYNLIIYFLDSKEDLIKVNINNSLINKETNLTIDKVSYIDKEEVYNFESIYIYDEKSTKRMNLKDINDMLNSYFYYCEAYMNCFYNYRFKDLEKEYIYKYFQ